MILQNCIFSENRECTELFYRGSQTINVDGKSVVIPNGQELRTDTYMNCLDIGTWKKYTDVSDVFLRIHFKGTGKVFLVCEQSDGSKKTKDFGAKDFSGKIRLPDEFVNGIVYAVIQAETDMEIYEACFETEQEQERKCKIALVICTYKRKQCLERVLETLKAGNAFSQADKWLDVTVVDNASELPDAYGDSIRVFHNQNTGGSGGFSRGMDEVVANRNHFNATHVVLMDDDVELYFESFIRLRALMSYLKEEYVSEPVAGRMFRLDKPTFQYTAAEIWNGGDLRHIGWNLDMADRSNLWEVNQNSGAEYGGWWFACYPMEFVKYNRPLPFFLHCDDVEYGLRHGGTPIILNGIQVWHETAEYRQTPVMAYYDTRNALIVNELYGMLPDKEILVKQWKERINRKYSDGDYLAAYMIIKGIRDFLRGLRWLIEHDSLKNHKKLLSGKATCLIKKMKNIWWRKILAKAEQVIG